MSKRVIATDQIQKTMQAALGDPEAQAANYAIFEARLLSTDPLKQSGFFNGAVISLATLLEMSATLNVEGSAVPVQVMHNNEVLPVGKVITAKVMQMANGGQELRGQFIVPIDKANLISDIENSIIDEVSVGLLTKAACCSACGFDYFGKGTDAMIARMNRVCPEDHTLGADGVHLNMNGMDTWSELSLVGKGAANKAKIMSRAKMALGQATTDRLAASGVPVDAFILTASYQMEDKSNPKSGDKQMDMEKLVGQLSTQSGELATTKLQLSQSAEAAVIAVAEIADLKAKLTASEATKDTEKKTLEASLTAVNAELASAHEKLMPHAKAALVASGVAEAELPKTFTALLSMIESKGLKLHQVFGSGPTGAGGKDDVTKVDPSEAHRKEAFKLSNK